MEIPKETLRYCADLGFVACRLPAMREYALNIFQGIKEVAPDNPAWIIGVAMVYANCDNNTKEACHFMMKQEVSAESGDLMARAFLGLFLIMEKRTSEGERIMRVVLADGSDPDAARLAQSALDNMS